MNHIVHIHAAALPDSLRWLRRATTILLVLVNLALTLWANTPR